MKQFTLQFSLPIVFGLVVVIHVRNSKLMYHRKYHMLFLFIHMLFISKFFIANSTICAFFIHVLSNTFYQLMDHSNTTLVCFFCSWTFTSHDLYQEIFYCKYYNLVFFHSSTSKYLIPHYYAFFVHEHSHDHISKCFIAKHYNLVFYQIMYYCKYHTALVCFFVHEHSYTLYQLFF